MSSYWGKHPAVFITFTSRYIRLLVGNKHHQITHIVQKILQEEWAENGEISQAEEVTKTLRTIVKQLKLTGMKTYISYSAHDLLLRSTTIPSDVPADEWKGHLYMNLGESFHLPFKDPIIEIVGSSEKDGAWEVNTLAVPEEAVNRIVSIVQQAKLRPIVMDVPFLNLYRVFQYEKQLEETSHVLLVHAEFDVIQLSLFHQHEPLYVRTVDLEALNAYSALESRSGFQYLESFEDEMTLQSHKEMMIKEIDRIQSFYQFNLQAGTSKIDTICIAGDHPKLVELKEYYASQDTANVSMLHDEAWGTKTKKKIPDSFAELIGLSLK
ncbi:type IV pilus biogenesis protein PilM [Paenisporosarcina cavernae]|uniref:type IV pilus biogenesis protein PilM n=1 Tax=Paenisporosarcina cavernae TaxID=2320858 RepID=UPI0013C4AF0E|nr:pilus assembly protein PilM [Paenisporosarcina cavernae]